MAEEQQKVVNRDTPEVPEARAALVKDTLGQIEGAREHWESAFKRMKSDMKFARGIQWPKQTENDERYVADIVNQHIRRAVSSIYARNPKVIAKRRQRIEHTVWDGKGESLARAKEAAMMASQPGMVLSPQSTVELQRAQGIIADANQVKQRMDMLNRLGRTMEILFDHQLAEGNPKFKIQAKQLVRRAKTCGVGFLKIGYQRVMGRTIELDAKIKDASDRIAKIEQLSADVADGEVQDNAAEMEELRLLVQTLQQEAEMVVREGLIFDFPRSYALIIDPDCSQLKGFVGAQWLAHELIYSPKQVQRLWNVDLGKDFTGYDKEGKMPSGRQKGKNKYGYAKVYEFYDLVGQTVCVVCDGYKDFLAEPASPETVFEQGHGFFALSFNDVEDDENIYPPSDVQKIKHIQLERNRSREALRQHRIANRPATVGAKGLFSKDDKEKMQTHEVGEHIELDALSASDAQSKVQDKMMAKPTVAIDASIYQTDYLDDDYLRTSGQQVANIGPTSDSTATEASIAETSRMGEVQSDADDLDEFLTDVARAAGQVLLAEMTAETVKRIVGPGAVWPEMDRKAMQEEVYLEIKAGSSGRPNKALKVANMERLAPFIVQAPGITPAWWARELVQQVDDTIDLTEAVLDGQPSMTAMNAMAQPSTGDPATSPEQQGPRGRANNPAPPQSQPGPQAGNLPVPPGVAGVPRPSGDYPVGMPS